MPIVPATKIPRRLYASLLLRQWLDIKGLVNNSQLVIGVDLKDEMQKLEGELALL